MIKQFLFSLIILFLFGAFSFPPKIKVQVDNPLNDSIFVNLDGKDSFWVAPKKIKNILLKAGKHSFTTSIKGKVYCNGYFDSPFDGVMNATKSVYVVWKDIFMKEEKEEYYDNIDESEVIIHGKSYFADLKVFDENSFYIPVEWDFGLETPFPRTVSLGDEPFKLLTKIYREQEFVREYNNIPN